MQTEPTVGEWLEGWRDLFPGRRSPATLEHDRYMVAAFARRYDRRRLDSITPLQAQAWAVKHPGQVRYLRQAWSKALLMGLVPFNVWRVVELPPRTAPRRPVPTDEQLEAIVGRCLERGGWWLEYADLVLFAAHTGARSAGVCGLRRGDVELPSRRVVLCEKGAKIRRVALLGHAPDALSRQLERHPWADLVWRGQMRRPLDRERIGVAWRAVRGDFPGPFHTLRHYAATWMAGQGADERDIAIQLGHTDAEGRPYTRMLTRIYVHPDHEPALERLALACDEQTVPELRNAVHRP